MALFLVQHGISASREEDPEKGLSSIGIEETNRIAQVAKGYGVPVAKIVHSGKRRAEQTAQIYHKALGLDVPLKAIPGIKPMEDVKTFSSLIDPRANWMVVGHLPFMERLVSYLTCGSSKALVYQFQNSGVVCLDAGEGVKGEGDWFIKWTLNPNIS
jgi:phosphohistidine phosphatase